MENTSDNKGFKVHVLVFWICVAGTIMMLLAGAKFWMHYMKHKDNIKARAVMLIGVTPPERTTGFEEARNWVAQYSDAFPNCRCMMGDPGHRKEDDRAMLFCIGFDTGRDSCEIREDKLPEGVTIKVSGKSNIEVYSKVLFLLSRYTRRDIIHPVTNRELEEPQD